MKIYSSKITLSKNDRGIYCLDTSVGCSSGMKDNSKGCYNDCYSAHFAKLYGYDFSTTILRHFTSKQHERNIITEINKASMPFIRIGCSGDPSENWEHCISILKVIANCNKEVVIITRHWTLLTDGQLQYLSTINVCVNTSVSALDKDPYRQVEQYKRLKPYCKAVLRIVSCDFNLDNPEGHRLHKIQATLFANGNTLDTVFRPNKNNPLVVNGVINTSTGLFNGKKCLMSKVNKKTYTGKCSSCHEMCGVNIFSGNNKIPILKQQLIFRK